MKFMFYMAVGLLAVSLVSIVSMAATIALLTWGGI